MKRLEELVLEARRICDDDGPIVVEAADTPEVRIEKGHGMRLVGKLADPSFLQAGEASKQAAPDIRGSRLLRQALSLVVPPNSVAINGLRPLLQRCELRARNVLALSTGFTDEMVQCLCEHNAGGLPTAGFLLDSEGMRAYRDGTPDLENYTGSLGAGGIETGWEFECVEVRSAELLLYDKTYRHLPTAVKLVIGMQHREETAEACQEARDMIDGRTMSSLYRAIAPPQ